jgi:translocation and assembly module TamB
MRWRRIILATTVLVLVGVPLATARYALHSETGLRFLLGQLARLPAVRVEATGASGTLAGPLAIERLIVEHEAVRIEMRDLRLNLRTRSLLTGNVHLEQASAGRIDVTLRAREERPPEVPHFLPPFLEIEAPDARLAEVSVTLADGQRLEVERLSAALAMNRWRIDLADVVVEDAAGRVDGALTLRAKLPLALRAAANGRWRLPDGRHYRFALAARGDLGRLATTLTLSEPANLSFTGNALALADAPRVVGTLRASDFDGSPWVEAGRWPLVSGSVAVDASAQAFGLDGTLSSAALGEGPLRLQGSGRWLERTLEISSLRAWWPRSTATLQVCGSMKFVAPAPELDLDGEWTALRWPLIGEAAVESAVGTLSVRGALPYEFSMQAHALLPGVPAADFIAGGTVDRGQLVLDRFDGRVLGGRLAGSGQLSWVGDQRWSARLDAKNLDIAAVRPQFPGRMSAVATIEGRGFTLASPWTARLASLSGSVRGRALSGRGEISHRDGTYDLRSVRIANGESHIDVDGRWGQTLDLRWRADVRELGLLHPDLAGEVQSSGRIHGRLERPQVAGELRARRVRVGEASAEALQADVDVDLTDARDSSLDLRATTIEVGPLVLDTARLDARGRPDEHGLTLEFYSSGNTEERLPQLQARVAVSGDYDAASRTWRGSVNEASFTFADGGATLLQPASIEMSPSVLRVAPLCLSTGEARLCAEGERVAQPAAWRVIYSAQDWPLRRLLRSLLGWREFDGRLQAAGWLAQEQGRDWLGGMTMLLDEPTLDIPRNKFRTDRVRLGSGRVDVFAEPQELRATVELDLAEGTRVRGQATARRDPALPPANYPLSGLLRVESAALTGIPVLVPEIDRSDGSLDASVAVAGTLGNPRFDGEFHVRDGRFDLYRTNLLFSDVALDGRFVGDELVFDGRGKTARGSIAFDGRFSWPEDVMTGAMRLQGEQLLVADTPEFRIVASPDIALTAGRDGYEVTGRVLIPQARIAPKDLSTTVATSPDERVVGLEVEEEGPSTLERVRSRVTVEIGNDVRVDSYGLKARLGGAVTVITQPDDVVRGDGSIRIVEGEYKAFGQYVRIVRGVLSYEKTPLDQPTLDLVGEREIKQEDIVVSINVRGTLGAPFITLSSEPPLPENEALSYLLTGRSINTLQSGEAASLDSAAQSLAVSGGGFLLGGIGTRIGLDEVSVEQTGEDDTSVVLGKFLSPKLFVSYGISIAEAINTIKLRYTLNERWSLKAEAGLEQAADVEFKIER